MQNSKEILNIIKQRGLNVQEIERQSGIKGGRIYKWLNGAGNPKVEDSEKLIKWAGQYLEDVPRATKEAEAVQGPDKEKGLTMQALVNLTESNKTLSDSNKILAESHR